MGILLIGVAVTIGRIARFLDRDRVSSRRVGSECIVALEEHACGYVVTREE